VSRSKRDCGHKLRTEQVISHDIVKLIDQCDIFGTEGFFQCLNFQPQFLDRFAVFLRRGRNSRGRPLNAPASLRSPVPANRRQAASYRAGLGRHNMREI
jgi:hypothetical protein